LALREIIPKNIFPKVRLNRLNQKSSLREMLDSKTYAQIGDALINLAATICLLVSENPAGPANNRVSNRFLRDAAKSSSLIQFLPKRATAHQIGDAVEALLAFAWLSRFVDLEDIVRALSNTDTDTEMSKLIDTIIRRAKW